MSRDKTNGTEASSPETAEPRARLTPIDVQQKEFRVSRFGGYKMRDVDEFLDQITDTLTALTTENERQRTASAGPMTASPDMDDVARQADEIIGRARADAARIVAEAKASGATGISATSPADRAAVNAFLSREREFLQSLAGLVQEHAEAVKGMAKSARPAAPPPPVKAKSEAAPAAAPVAERSSEEVRAPERRDAGPGTPGTTPVQEPAVAPSAGGGAAATQAGMGEPASSSEDAPTREPTRVPESEATVRLQEPASAAASREGDTEADRSLRDLFWGED